MAQVVVLEAFALYQTPVEQVSAITKLYALLCLPSLLWLIPFGFLVTTNRIAKTPFE